MKVELTIEKNVILKRDKPWSRFYFLNDNELLCSNEHKKFELVNSSNGKIEHISNKTISHISKSSLSHCLSNNGQLCAFLASNYEITIWDKDKLIRTIPPCPLAIKAIKTTPQIYISNNGEQAILILQQPYRLFLWLKLSHSQLISIKRHHKSPICSSIASHPTGEIGTWHELNLANQQFDIMNDDQHEISIDCFFRSKNSSIICAFAYFDTSGYIQINRIDINWKSTIYSEQLISYSFEILQIPIMLSSLSSSLCFIHFAHTSPILAIGLSTNILLISLTTIIFSKLIPIDCSFKTSSPSHQQVFINDLIWSYDDQFIIGLTNRGALFFLNRFGSQLNLITQGECITQGPSLFVIIHPLIGKDSEATTHLGLDSFMKSIAPFSDDDKTKQQKFSLAVNTNKSLIYCSDGYRLARLTYSNKIRDRRFYDPLLSLYLMDVNKQQDHSVFIHKARSFDEFPKVGDRIDTESIGGGGEVNMSKKYGSLTSLAIDDLPELSLDDIFSAYHLLLTSSERVQHEICSCLERTTQTILLASNNEDILTSIQLSHCLTDLVLSSSFGSLTFLHISCLTKFIPLFIDVFKQQTTVVNDPELLELCILYIVEQWLQAILYIPTKLNTFELCRRQKVVEYNEGEEEQEEEDEKNFRLCKGIKQLGLLQGTHINLDDFLPSSLPNRRQGLQANDSHYNRFTLLRSWYKLWLTIEKKFYLDVKNLPKYLTTIRLFIQSILQSYPSLNAIRLLPYGQQIDLNDLFPPAIAPVDHPLHTKGYSGLNERRKQRRRSRNSIDMPNSVRTYRRGKPPTEARKALALHRVLYALLEQYNIRDAVCILNVALKRETSLLSSCLPIDLFSSNLFQHIDTRTYFGMPGNALRSVLRTLARFMARSMITTDNNDEQYHQQLFIYSVDSACPLPNLFKTKQKVNEQIKHRMIYIDRNRLNLAIQQQKMSKFWQPLKVLELFILGQSPNEAVRKQTKNETNDSFYSIKALLKSLRFHKLPNIPDRILIYFRDFCIILFLLDTRDRLSLTLRNYLRYKIELTNPSDKLSWKIISYATILLSFRCLISDEMDLLRIVLNLFFDLTPSEQLMRAFATLIIARQHQDNDTDNNDEITLIIDKLKAKWMQINPTYIQLYEGFLETIILQDVQGDIIQHYMNDIHDHHNQEPLFDFKPKWFETCVEYGEFMTMLIPLLLDTSSLTNTKQQELNNDHTKFDSKSIPLLQTMSTQLRELELPISLDKRYLLKQSPLFVPPHEYIVFPVRMVPYDAQQTMFQQTPTSINNTTIGSFVNTSSTQQPPGVVILENHHRRNYSNSDSNNNNNNNAGNLSMEWDGRSDDPSRSYVRQFDEPYAEAARRSIWMVGWANRDFTTTTDQTQTTGMRIPVSAQFLASSSLVSDPQHYETLVKQHSQQTKLNNDQADNDTDLTNVTKDSEDDDGSHTQSDFPSSPRRRDVSFRRNSLEESVSLPVMSNDGGGDFGRSHDFRAPSRETGIDETLTYDPRDMLADYKDSTGHQPRYQQRSSPPSHISPSTTNGFQQQQSPHSVRQSNSDRRFLDDSDPYLPLRLEQEEREKYAMRDTDRTITSKQSPLGHYPSYREPYSHQPTFQDSNSRRSPTRDPHSHRSPTRDAYSHRSSSRDPQRDRQHHQYFPQIPVPPSSYDQVRAPATIQYIPSIRLPLLHLGGPVYTTTTMLTQARLPPPPPPPPPPVAVYPARPIYVPAAPRPPLPMLHFAPQLPPPVAISPRATRADQQKFSCVQNIMHQYAESNRPRLQLLQMRPPLKTLNTTQIDVPMPAPNIVTTSSDTKVDTGIQVEVPRQDGFVIEPGLFQALLRDATGVNFTSAEAHFSAARQIQQQAIEARRRERSTMTDLPAHQILYDLQYARGGEGDERKFVNVTDIAGPHADALLAQIRRDQIEREQLHLSQQQQQQQPPPIPMVTNINEMPSTSYPIGFERQHTQILQQQQESTTQPSYPNGFERQPLGFYNSDELQQKSELILQRRRQREQEEKQAEQIAFGNIDDDRSKRRVSYEPYVQTYEPDEHDVPLEYLIRQPRPTEPISDTSSHVVDPISVRSTTPRSPRKPVSSEYPISIKTTTPRDPFSPRKQVSSEHPISIKTTTPRDPFSPRKQVSSEHPISIKTTTPRDPFSPRKTVSHSSYSATGTPRKAASPTIADRHREARQRQQQSLSRARAENALRFADAVLHGEPIPPTRALEEFQIEPLETSFTSTVREMAGADGIINRTYDLDFNDDDDVDIGDDYSERIPSRPMSATTANFNHNATQYSTSSSALPRPSSASSARSSRPMTPMAKAIIQAKQKGPPPARSNMARKRPLSSPANLGQKRGSMTAPVKSSQARTKLVRTIRKASPPTHKPTTYNQRVRSLNKTDSEIRTMVKPDSTDPKALMRLYGTRRVPGLYVPYEKTEPRVTKTYSERMKELQRPTSAQPQTQRQSQRQQEGEFEQRPSSAPSSSASLSDWEVDDRVKQLLADDQDTLPNKKFTKTVTPLADLDELDDDNMDETTYSLTRVTEQTNENTYGDDLRLVLNRRSSALNTNTYGGTRVSARSSAGGDMTARDESELSRGDSSINSYMDWSALDREFPTGTQ
ncbi:unnamed protein product [Rotaria sp. Silwood2]|nr:unnamed protein product [Rotaria sp. Silwood2]